MKYKIYNKYHYIIFLFVEYIFLSTFIDLYIYLFGLLLLKCVRGCTMEKTLTHMEIVEKTGLYEQYNKKWDAMFIDVIAIYK